eukprot:CAMPEP_0194756266 /NCGR_PEP_ID=MMETSP0323_2-20130528/10000_1 /TAXON_ID=2866 ORGANISM="Crypthecodinium cohnii, Strain Seligo" /NCGR_SAMPLE_ID=MMETSP0323_2 /ASSEMBLY_ACC=CAM_ASM_000346 /LENGTH=37 /DNA_ID= /DNA_START= /DNA_END= /DNA_ORIENTATION=
MTTTGCAEALPPRMSARAIAKAPEAKLDPSMNLVLSM